MVGQLQGQNLFRFRGIGFEVTVVFWDYLGIMEEKWKLSTGSARVSTFAAACR